MVTGAWEDVGGRGRGEPHSQVRYKFCSLVVVRLLLDWLFCCDEVVYAPALFVVGTSSFHDTKVLRTDFQGEEILQGAQGGRKVGNSASRARTLFEPPSSG